MVVVVIPYVLPGGVAGVGGRTRACAGPHATRCMQFAMLHAQHARAHTRARTHTYTCAHALERQSHCHRATTPAHRATMGSSSREGSTTS